MFCAYFACRNDWNGFVPGYWKQFGTRRTCCASHHVFYHWIYRLCDFTPSWRDGDPISHRWVILHLRKPFLFSIIRVCSVLELLCVPFCVNHLFFISNYFRRVQRRCFRCRRSHSCANFARVLDTMASLGHQLTFLGSARWIELHPCTSLWRAGILVRHAQGCDYRCVHYPRNIGQLWCEQHWDLYWRKELGATWCVRILNFGRDGLIFGVDRCSVC